MMVLKEELKLHSRMEDPESIFLGSAEVIAEMYAVEFATWYSGMDKEKVKAAYKRFIDEQKQKEEKQ
jgi:hypothetical protein